MTEKTSIIIPVYNEEESIIHVINEVKKLKLDKEIVIVDDGSKDKTADLVEKQKGIRLIRHKTNLGRGGAIKTGINNARGSIIYVLDGDMEHKPTEELVKPILQNKADVVYGNRLHNPAGMTKLHLMGNKVLSLVGSFIAKQKLNDVYTGSKCFRKETIQSLNLESNGFEQEAELLVKLAKKRIKIKEVGIGYKTRSFGESSIGPMDGLNGIFTMIKFYFKYGLWRGLFK